jgi:hypothetical protein
MKSDRFVLTSVAMRIGKALQRADAASPSEIGGLGVITAPIGSGMSTSVRQAVEIHGWLNVEIHADPSARTVMNALHRAVFGDESVMYGSDQTFFRVLQKLKSGFWCGPIIVHNPERLNAKLMDIFVDVSESSGFFTVFCGSPRIRQFIMSALPGSLLEKAKSRIILDVDVPGPSLQDAKLMADELTEITIDGDLVEHCHRKAGGSVRSLLAQFRAVEEIAALTHLERIGLARWLALSGEPEEQLELATPRTAIAAPRLKALSKLDRGQPATTTKAEVA